MSPPKLDASGPERGTRLPGILMSLAAVAIVVLAWADTLAAKPWAQGYDPFGRWWLSTICAALPVVVLLGLWRPFA